MPNNDYANEPNQSRSEEIIQSILDNTEYDEAARSRIEYLLIELKNAIEGGGGGGGVTSYSPLTEKPKIDNHTLQAGNNTSSDLGLQTKIDPEHKLSADNVDDTNSTNKFNVKSDWNAASGATSEILNKPTLGTASVKNVPASGDAATGEVVLGSDTRLTDARNAKDVYNWAKQENKPSYNYSEIQNPPTIPDELSDLADDSTHRTVTDTEKDTWNGKQNALTFDDAPTSNSGNPVKSGGVYTALSGKQNNLSEAQMAAANSGATADKINKIAVNENNISYNTNNGVKNLLDVTITSNTFGGVTYTNNSDGTFTLVSGTASHNPTLLVLGAVNVKAGTYKLTGCPASGSDTTYRLDVRLGGTVIGGEYGNGVTLDISSDSTVSICIRLQQNYTVNNLLFRPMFRQIGDDTFVPYALPNTTITPALQECVDNGVKNLLNNKAVSASIFTVNADKTVTANGTGNATLTLATLTASEAYALNGMVLSGCPSGGSDSSYKLIIQRNSSPWNVYVRDLGNGAIISGIPEVACVVLIQVTADTTVSNLVFKPMICTQADWNVSHTYFPYALSNAELTNNISSLYKVGSANILKNTAQTQTVGNVTFTMNADGSITANGTKTDNEWLYLSTGNSLKAGTYVLSSGGITGNDKLVIVTTSDSLGSAIMLTNTATGVYERELTQDYSGLYFAIRIASGTVCDNLLFKPMLCEKSVYEAINGEYQPYAPSNRELFNMIMAL